MGCEGFLFTFATKEEGMDEIAILQINDITHNNLQTDFYANTLSQHLIDNHSHIERPHKHNFYVGVLFTKGKGIHEIDFNRYEVKPGSVFMLAPGQTHSWELSEDIEGYIFFHTQNFLDLYLLKETLRDYPVFRSAFYPNHVCLDEADTQVLAFVLNRMVKEVRQEQWKRNQQLVSLTLLFYIETNRILLQGETFKTINNNLYASHLQLFEELIEKHFAEEKSAAVYANWMNMTQKHLNRVCKTMVNQTTTDVILDRVVLEAKRMMIYTDYPLNDIASSLGYDDYSYFSKLFKKREGETPKEFFKRYQ